MHLLEFFFQWSISCTIHSHLLCHSFQSSMTTNGTVAHMNYVIQLFSPCESNRWAAVERPGSMWLRVALCSTVNVSDNDPDRESPRSHERWRGLYTQAPRSAEAQTRTSQLLQMADQINPCCVEGEMEPQSMRNMQRQVFDWKDVGF